jgi:hypothetical protein
MLILAAGIGRLTLSLLQAEAILMVAKVTQLLFCRSINDW